MAGREQDEGVFVAAHAVSNDKEIRAMESIIEIMEPLDRSARKRVLHWAWWRFVPQVLFDMSGPPSLEVPNHDDE